MHRKTLSALSLLQTLISSIYRVWFLYFLLDHIIYSSHQIPSHTLTISTFTWIVFNHQAFSRAISFLSNFTEENYHLITSTKSTNAWTSPWVMTLSTYQPNSPWCYLFNKEHFSPKTLMKFNLTRICVCLLMIDQILC